MTWVSEVTLFHGKQDDLLPFAHSTCETAPWDDADRDTWEAYGLGNHNSLAETAVPHRFIARRSTTGEVHFASFVNFTVSNLIVLS